MKPERIGDIYAIVCAGLCGLGTIPVKIGVSEISTELFNLSFFLFALLISLFTLLNKNSRNEIIQTKPASIGLIFIMTLFFTMGIYTFIHSIKLIQPATVSFLSRIEVVFTIVLAFIFLRERLRLMEIIGGLVAIVGVLLLKYDTNITVSKAASLMVASAIFFATAEVLVKRFVETVGTVRFVFFRNIFAVVMFFVILLIQGRDLYIPDSKTLLMAFLAALLLPILGRITYIQALRRINISRTALITQSTPLFTAIFAFAILGSIPSPVEWVGGIIIIVGVMIVRLPGEKSIGRKPKAVAKPPM